MDRDLRLGVNWAALRDKHMNSVRHDAHARALRDYGSRDKPAPWAAESRAVAPAVAQDPWAGAIGTATPSQWQGWQEWT
eukprot:3087356-Pyramimonas_sp.AAC.1